MNVILLNLIGYFIFYFAHYYFDSTKIWFPTDKTDERKHPKQPKPLLGDWVFLSPLSSNCTDFR